MISNLTLRELDHHIEIIEENEMLAHANAEGGEQTKNEIEARLHM